MIILLYFYLLQPCSIYCGEGSVLQSEYFKFERSRSSCFLCFNPFKMFFKDDQEEEVIKYYCNESYVEDFTNKLRSSLKSLAIVNVSNPTLKKNHFVVTVLGASVNIKKIRNILEKIRGPI